MVQLRYLQFTVSQQPLTIHLHELKLMNYLETDPTNPFSAIYLGQQGKVWAV